MFVALGVRLTLIIYFFCCISS